MVCNSDFKSLGYSTPISNNLLRSRGIWIINNILKSSGIQILIKMEGCEKIHGFC